jgi:hypothetical protein
MTVTVCAVGIKRLQSSKAPVFCGTDIFNQHFVVLVVFSAIGCMQLEREIASADWLS